MMDWNLAATYALLGLAAAIVVGYGAERAIAPPRTRILARQRPVARRVDVLGPAGWGVLMGVAAMLGWWLR